MADQLCQKWEGYNKKLANGDCKAYPDPGPSGLPITIGFGTTYYPSGTSAARKYGNRPVRLGDVLTREQAEECFVIVMNERDKLVSERLKAPVTQAMYDALVSFYYNLHPVSWPQQINRCNAGKYAECADSFDLYIFAGGKRLEGLVNRRNEEERLFRSEGLSPAGASLTSTLLVTEEAAASFDLFPYRPLRLPWQRDDDHLALGDKSADVIELRCGLIGLGLIPKSELVSDTFDIELENAVKKFQRLAGVKDDGIVGRITASAIENYLAAARGNSTTRLLSATYYSQRVNLNEPDATCGVTSAAILLSAKGTKVTPDELYNRFGKNAGQSPSGLANIYKSFGYNAKYSYSGTFANIRSAINLGSPVVIHGYFTRSGHIVCVVGYDRFGLVVHDPAGAWNGVPRTSYESLPKNGKTRSYSYDWLRPIEIYDGIIWFSHVTA
ncbi:C39 family peptidase [Cyanobium sp. NIES-981]|uniref:glycoside hydrolase family protein n=1 Tax=Cyanobium sp. NIES-981 TaxID=1851505 RepID=UPI0015619EB7|nr:C39 family peptidase [Cyanobium sp. NIES-981]